MSYFDNLPHELITEICFSLDYAQSLIISQVFINGKTVIDYKYLLMNKYPGFYKMLLLVKENDIYYKNYSFEKGYEIINNFQLYADALTNLNPSDEYNIKSDNPEDIFEIVVWRGVKIDDIENIVMSYNINEF